MEKQKLNVNGPLVVAALLLAAAFFIPWLNWAGTSVKGYDFPSGNFFSISESKFDLSNPFPEYSFVNYIFWLIPAGALLLVIMAFGRKRNWLLPAFVGVLALSLVTVYILFTQTIIEQVGIVKELLPSLKLGLYATIIAAVGIILAGIEKKWLLKLVLIIAGPLSTWAGFSFLSGKVLKDHDNTSAVKADYTLTSSELIGEFQKNDSLANVKYKEKVLVINGNVSEVEQLSDSTVNIKFADSTGSYAVFSFENPEAQEAKNIKEGDKVSLKGSCSGGEYSDILGVHFITFKRSIINK